MLCDIDECKDLIPAISPSLKILTQNIRSITCNFPGLLTLLARTKVHWDIIILSECWLKSTTQIPTINDYNAYFTINNCTQNEGVIVYIKKNLVVAVEEPPILDANCLLLKINLETVIIALYRPPGQKNTNNFFESLNDLLTKCSCYKNIIVTGDINIDIAQDNSDSRSSSYLNLMASHGMLPAHIFPTHSRTCLDHMVLKTKSYARCCVTNSSLTDHDCVILYLTLSVPPGHSVTTRKHVNNINLEKDIKNIDFKPIYEMSDANVATNYLISVLTAVITANTNIIKIPSRKVIKKPWMTPGLLRCIKNRDNLHKKIKADPTNELIKITYKRYRNYCNKILKTTKNQFEKNQILKAGSNNKKLWDVIKDITYTNKQKHSPIDLISPTNPTQSVNNVNAFFANVGKSLAEKIHSNDSITLTDDFPSTPPVNSFVMLPTDEAEVEMLISKLRSDCATGVDNISGAFVKQFKSILVPPITHICNLSISTGVFPRLLKRSLIIPIHKKGDRDCVNNYRPISILPSISKILERVMNTRLTKYLESNSLISPSQYGFRKGKSTADAVHELTDFIVDKLDKKQKTLAIFLDLAKAFDTVSVPILVSKLERMGVRDLQLRLFEDYLADRTQCVKIGEHVSEEVEISYGAPQGSILGPTLFLVYINDLCRLHLTNGRIITFADDTVVLFHAASWSEVYQYAQIGFDIVAKSLIRNKLTLNVDKTKYTTFALKSPPTLSRNSIIAHSCIDSKESSCQCPYLEHTTQIKYLGILIDNRLTFQPHIELLTARIRKLIFIFKNLRHVANPKIIKIVYFALCQSLLSYCISSWGGAHKTHILKLERAQRAVLKVSQSLPYLYPTTSLYKQSKVLTVRQLFILHIILKQHSHVPFDPFSLSSKRRKDKVCPPNKFNTRFSHRFFCFLGGFLYNKISSELTIYPLTLSRCKMTVTNWLQSLDYSATENLLHIVS